MYNTTQRADTMQVMAKKKPEPVAATRPTSLVMTFKCEGELLEAFLDFQAAQRIPPNKSDIIILSLQELLQREGYYPPKRKAD